MLPRSARLGWSGVVWSCRLECSGPLSGLSVDTLLLRDRSDRLSSYIISCSNCRLLWIVSTWPAPFLPAGAVCPRVPVWEATTLPPSRCSNSWLLRSIPASVSSYNTESMELGPDTELEPVDPSELHSEQTS